MNEIYVSCSGCVIRLHGEHASIYIDPPAGEPAAHWSDRTAAAVVLIEDLRKAIKVADGLLTTGERRGSHG